MRFHILTPSNTVSNSEHVACAFTQNVVKFCSMMMPRTEMEKDLKKNLSIDELIQHKTIHHLIHYGHEKSDVNVDEHVTVIDDDILEKTYGQYDWKKGFYKSEHTDLARITYTTNTINEINKRKHWGDFLLCFWGIGHKPIADAFTNDLIIVEPGAGYLIESTFAPYKVFPSYAWMHANYGANKIYPVWYDSVIPHYFNPTDFDFKKDKSDYFLYLGRITTLKGVGILIDIAKKMGFRLIIAGQGSIEDDLGIKELPSNIEYVGFADQNKRRQLMSNAKALVLLSTYSEPFGCVIIEAMMSGTPVITTDWGAFSEIVLHGATGYRCRTMDHIEWAINNIDKINPQTCRQWAVDNYSVEKIRLMYEEYFDMVVKVQLKAGFYEKNPNRTELDWLSKTYPKGYPQIE